jgi:hypothetical protein
MMPGVPERRTHSYVQHGTTSLFAALDVASGVVFGGSVQNLSHICSGNCGSGLVDVALIERAHVHVAFCRPCRACGVAQPRRCEVQARSSVRKCADNPYATSATGLSSS